MSLEARAALMKRIFETNETNITNWRQNHPELVVQDLRVLLDLNDSQCSLVRRVLMLRGVNKWLLARRKFIDLKHRLKEFVKRCRVEKAITFKELRKAVFKVYEEMQHIGHAPRWVEWGTYVHHKMSENDKDVKVMGRGT